MGKVGELGVQLARVTSDQVCRFHSVVLFCTFVFILTFSLLEWERGWQ